MTSSASAVSGLAQTRAAPAAAVDVAVIDSLAEAEAVWHHLEAHGTVSPYQRFAWVRAFVDGLGEATRTRVIVLRDPSGTPLLAMPVTLGRLGLLRYAGSTGGKHANFHLPLIAAEASGRLTPAALRDALMEAGRRIGVDQFVLRNMPAVWAGVPNPLALPEARPSPSDAFRLDLADDAEATFRRAMSNDARKKLRKKEKYLAALGHVDCLVATSEAEVNAILEVFFHQKAARMREIGVADPFGDAGTRAFVRQACLAGLGDGSPAIELYALRVDGRIVATFGGAADARRLCGMFNTFDPSPEIARCSPGDLLLQHVIRLQCERGRTAFDLGVGEARYKSSLCDSVEPLVDLTLPVTWRGRVGAAASIRAAAAKRAIKQSPALWAFVRRARALKGRLGL
jgi:CelD/BcsL family acetyltransferase involved in cellulose biosynthesis